MALANTTTVSLNAVAITKVTDFSFNKGGEKLDITGLEDAAALYEAGVPDVDAQITAHGDHTALLGTTGTLVVGSTSITNMGCYKVELKGTTKGQVMSTISLCPVA